MIGRALLRLASLSDHDRPAAGQCSLIAGVVGLVAVVTVTSQPQSSFGQRNTSPSPNMVLTSFAASPGCLHRQDQTRPQGPFPVVSVVDD